MALLVVIGLANVAPYILTVLIWRAAICEQGCWSASSIWLMPELALGVGLLFFLGAGLIVGPACLILDALLRIGELMPQPVPRVPREDEISLGVEL